MNKICISVQNVVNDEMSSIIVGPQDFPNQKKACKEIEAKSSYSQLDQNEDWQHHQVRNF